MTDEYHSTWQATPRRLRHLDGREISHIMGCSIDGFWPHVQSICGRVFECDPDDVDLIEDEDGNEFVAVHGERVAMLTLAG